MSETLNSEPRSFAERAADSEDRIAYNQAHSGANVDPGNYPSEQLYLQALKAAREQAEHDDYPDMQAYLDSRPATQEEVVGFTDDMIAEKRAQLDSTLFEDMLGKSDDLKQAYVMAKMVANIKRNSVSDVVDMNNESEAQKHMDIIASIKQREDNIHALLESFLTSESAAHLSDHDKEMLALAVIDATESPEDAIETKRDALDIYIGGSSTESEAKEGDSSPAPAEVPAPEVSADTGSGDSTDSPKTSVENNEPDPVTGSDSIPEDSAKAEPASGAESDPTSPEAEGTQEAEAAADDATSSENQVETDGEDSDESDTSSNEENPLDVIINSRLERKESKKEKKGLIKSLGKLAVKQVIKGFKAIKNFAIDVAKAFPEEFQKQKGKIDKLKESADDEQESDTASKQEANDESQEDQERPPVPEALQEGRVGFKEALGEARKKNPNIATETWKRIYLFNFSISYPNEKVVFWDQGASKWVKDKAGAKPGSNMADHLAKLESCWLTQDQLNVVLSKVEKPSSEKEE